eukprot:11953767-Alexandrium_andersonii.AAC.1
MQDLVKALRKFPMRATIVGQDPNQILAMDQAANKEAHEANIGKICEYFFRRGIPAIHGETMWRAVDEAAGGHRQPLGPDGYHFVYRPADDQQ